MRSLPESRSNLVFERTQAAVSMAGLPLPWLSSGARKTASHGCSGLYLKILYYSFMLWKNSKYFFYIFLNFNTVVEIFRYSWNVLVI